MNQLAWAYQDAGKLDLALPLFEETLERTKAKLGPDHPDTLHQHEQSRLGVPGRPASSTWPCRSTKRHSARKAKLGPDHNDTLQSMNNLALGYRAAGKRDLALPLFEETLEADEGEARPDHADTLTTMNNLAWPTGTPASSTWPCRSSRRRSSGGRRSSAPTTPTCLEA